MSASFQARVEDRCFFESCGRPLYGVLRPGTRPNAPLVLFCNCFSENHWEWRAEVIGARVCAERGYPTFRYHPRAHGDSTGNPAEVTFDGLVEDAMAAADHALEGSGASRIVWVGVRFGAMVAAEALARRNDAAALVLWEPVVRARDHFRKLMRHVLYYELSQGERPSLTVEEMVESIEREGRVSVLRFDLEREFFRSAIDLDLLRIIGGWSGPTMLAQFNRHSRLSREHLSLKDHLERQGATVVEAMFAEQANPDDSGDPWRVPEAIIGRMGEWLDEMG